MNHFTHALSIASLALVSTVASADMPQMGGPMKHVGVMFHEEHNHFQLHVDDSVPTPILANGGGTYMGAASALDGLLHNAQYGWMVEGFWTPPAGSSIWIEQISATPGLMAFRGGMMSMMGAHTFAPIFGTDGSDTKLMWNGMMMHNWYAAATPGDYAAEYRVYFGDSAGVPTPGYDPATVVLEWTAIPSPSSLALIGLGALAATRRRR
jgi:hypothetical protein